MKKLFALLIAAVLPLSASALTCNKIIAAGASISAVVDNAVAGDVICLRGGTYHEIGVWISASGTSGNHVTVMAYPGEYPVLDGTGVPAADYESFFQVRGQYIDLSGIKVKNGNVTGMRGVLVIGNNATVKNMTIDNVTDQGILVDANNVTIEGNVVVRAAMGNLDRSSPAGWAFGVGTFDSSGTKTYTGLVIRGNAVHDSWGEGISLSQSNGAIVEDNTVYDNFSANLFITASNNAIVRRNLSYNTPDNSTSSRASGILMAEQPPGNPSSTGNTVVNNLIYNADYVAYQWTEINNTGLNNALIANNTIVNGAFLTGTGTPQNITNVNSKIKNNIIYRNDGGSTGTVPSATGLTYSNNVWYPTRPTNASGSGDVVGSDPLLAKIGSTGNGQLAPGYFKINYGSPAVNAGAVISTVTTDYFGAARDSTPVIGAHELTCQ